MIAKINAPQIPTNRKKLLSKHHLAFRSLISIKRQYFYPGQIGTVVSDRIQRNTTIYMVPYYDRWSPCRIRRKKRSFTVSVHGGHIRARRYTMVIRDHVIRQNTVVYGEIRTVCDRLRAYTDSVFVDLGIDPNTSAL